jgi:HAD superfamily phosphoserine phosphatase-like hydrolase
MFFLCALVLTLIRDCVCTKIPLVAALDWDITITESDTGAAFTNVHGLQEHLENEFKRGAITWRQAVADMWSGSNVDIRKAQEMVVKTVTLDPTFIHFCEEMKRVGGKIVIISSGMKQLIRPLLPEGYDIEVIANELSVEPNGFWKVDFVHPDSPEGHNKAQSLIEVMARQSPGTDAFFVGDGYSDFGVAQELLALLQKGQLTDWGRITFFAKRGLALEETYKERNIPYNSFDRLSDVEKVLRNMYSQKFDTAH